MEHTFEHIELFEAYQSKTMTDKEILVFEARLSYDQEFKAEFNRFQKLEEGIKQHFRTEFKNKLNELDNELALDNAATPKNNVRKLYWITSAVAASLIIGILLFNFYTTEYKNSQLAQQYWIVEEGLPVKMSTKGIYDDAMNAFKQEQWQEAENLLVAINSDTASYFLGVINYQQNEFNKSASYFSQVPETSVWYEQSQYRLALVYLHKKDLELAKKILQKQMDNNSLFKEQAISILDKLK
jgi:tetratricopeptide (TPR) repeat protein